MASKKELKPGETGFIEEYLVPPGFDADGVQSTSGIGLDGREHPDPLPMAPPAGVSQDLPLAQMIRNMVRQETFRQEVERAGYGSFEEEDDFDIDDDPPDPQTEYERLFDAPVVRPPGAAEGREPAEAPAPATSPAAPAQPAPAEPAVPAERASSEKKPA